MNVQRLVFAASLVFAGFIAVSQAALTDSLVGYWSMDSINGTVVPDLSGHGNDGDLKGNPTKIDGKFGKALLFDGLVKDDFIDVPRNPSIEPPKELSISVWVNQKDDGLQVTPQNSYGNPCNFIVSKSTMVETPPYSSYDLQTHVDCGGGEANPMIIFQCNVNGTFATPNRCADIKLNEWVHLVATFSSSAGKVRIYWNGVLAYDQSIGQGASITYYNTGMRIGAASSVEDNSEWPGAIDEVMFFRRAITQAEVTELYTNGIKLNPTKIDAIYRQSFKSVNASKITSADIFKASMMGNSGYIITDLTGKTISNRAGAQSMSKGLYLIKSTKTANSAVSKVVIQK